jgi:flagellar hook-length control protein FliK
MEKVTVLSIDLGQSSEFKGVNSPAQNSASESRDDFSQVLNQQISSEKSGKEANANGKATTMPIKDQPAKDDNGITVEMLDKTAEKIDETVDVVLVDDELDKSELSLTISDSEIITESEQLLALLQNAELTLLNNTADSLAKNSSADDVLDETDALIQQLSNDNDSPTIINASLLSGDKNSAASLVDEALTKLKIPQQNSETKNSTLEQLNINQTLVNEELASEAPNSEELGDVIDGDVAKILADKALSTQELAKLAKDLPAISNILTDKNVRDLLKTGDSEQLLANLAQLKELQLKSENILAPQNNAVAQNVTTTQINPALAELAKQASLNVTDTNDEKVNLPDKIASVEKLLENPLIKEQILSNKAAQVDNTSVIKTPGIVTASTAESLGAMPSAEYSGEELREIQSLQVIANQVADTNVQNQKVELANKLETIAVFRKDFTTALQDKVLVLVQQKIQQVDIRLDPPELGQMQVRVNLQNEQASVQFIVQNQQAKEVLDQNMPKLKEMLAEQGVNVGDANVGQRNDQGSQNDKECRTNEKGNNLTDDEYIDGSAQAFSANLFKGSAVGVDYYA